MMSTESTKSTIREKVKKANLKATSNRLEILEIFYKFSHPLSAEVIHKKIGAGKSDLATVYRTLSVFLEKEIIKKVKIGGTSSLYELKDDHHHHIVCQDCGLIEDFNICHISKLQNVIMRSARHFKKIKDHSFELFGVCQKCEKKQEH